MKHKNLKIGLQVQVKEHLSITNWSAYKGEVAEVIEINPDVNVALGVRLKFHNGFVRWGSVADIRKISSTDTSTN